MYSSLYIEHSNVLEAVSADWENVPPEKMFQALLAMRRILGKPTTINDRKIK